MLHGDRPDAVCWSAKGQLLRYDAMLDIGDINGSKILDFTMFVYKELNL